MTQAFGAELVVRSLRKEFRIRTRNSSESVTAVEDVSFEVAPGETVALVGESGSGKSTVARCISRLIEPTEGEVHLAGRDLMSLPRRQVPQIYRDLQMVFQDPNGSLNPRMTVRKAIEEPLRVHSGLSGPDMESRVLQLIEDVELSSEHLDRYPRQLSGGQRQRVGIARALAVEPKFIVLDEPTASLDVSTRRRILKLLARIQRERVLGYLFISHDLDTVRRFADRVLVMYLGSIVESGSTSDVFESPAHPYTRALLSSAPVIDPGRMKQRIRLTGEVSSAVRDSNGCRLASRCPYVQNACLRHIPPLVAISPTHSAACPVLNAVPVPERREVTSSAL
ncbi:MAG: oligopeptide/dipeptide ABC transporter ATP-binding protein [Acidimicrobiales bacterium]|jgi:peptide/nickel transport system ATP-binding protein/oligopeptide transport system ATP-binding protein